MAPETPPVHVPVAVAVRIGVLDLQGDVQEHVAALEQVGAGSQLVKRPADLEGLDGLILPGGESTTLSMLLESTGLFDAIATRIGAETGSDEALPLLGTCAGLVLVANEVLDGRPDQRTFGVLDAVVRRNGYGRQVRSFEGEVQLGSDEDRPLPAVFIRAPYVESVGDEVEVLGTLDDVPVLVRQGAVLASVFHPELTPDRRVHKLFVQMCRTRGTDLRAAATATATATSATATAATGAASAPPPSGA